MNACEAKGRQVTAAKAAAVVRRFLEPRASSLSLSWQLAVVGGGRVRAMASDGASVDMPCDYHGEPVTVGRDALAAVMARPDGAASVPQRLPVDAMPVAVDVRKVDAEWSADVAQLRGLLASVLPARADDEGRYSITGVYIKRVEGRTVMAATDGRRLHCVGGDPGSLVGGWVVDRADDLLAVLAVMRGDATVRVCDGRWMDVTDGTVRARVPLMDIRFPNYWGIVRKSCQSTVVVDAGALAGIVREAAKFAPKDVTQREERAGVSRVRAVDVAMTGDGVTVTASGDAGNYSASVPGTLKGTPTAVFLRPEFLADALESFGGGRVTIGADDDSVPIDIRSESSPLRVAIMPISK